MKQSIEQQPQGALSPEEQAVLAGRISELLAAESAVEAAIRAAQVAQGVRQVREDNYGLAA